MPGTDPLMAKYAKKPGWFQWVRPGTIRRSKSAMTRSRGSGAAGGRSGSASRTSPGFTRARTGKRSGASRNRATHSTASWPRRRNSSTDRSPSGPDGEGRTEGGVIGASGRASRGAAHDGPAGPRPDGDEDRRRLVVVDEVPLRDPLDVLAGDGPDPRQVLVAHPPPARALVPAEGGRAGVEGGLAEEVARLDLGLGAPQLLLGRQLGAEPLDLGGERALGFPQRLLGQHGHVEGEDVGIGGQVAVVAPGVEGEAGPVHEALAEPRPPGRGKERPEDLERRGARGAEVRHRATDVHDGELCLLRSRPPALRVPRR